MPSSKAGKDIAITISGLARIIPDAAREEIVLTLVDVPSIKVINSETGEILIPEEYFV